MSHNIEGFIANKDSLVSALKQYDEAHVLLLKAGSLAFVPLTYELEEVLPPRHFRNYDFPVAKIRTDYFGGAGEQKASVRCGNAFQLRKGSINDALNLLGIQRSPEHGDDEFDIVGLGDWRTNEAWIANAPHASPPKTIKFSTIEEYTTSPQGSCTSPPIRAFLLHRVNDSPYLSFGTDAVEAAKVLAAKLGCAYDEFGVGGSYPIDEPIFLGHLWPYFTNEPTEPMVKHVEEKRKRSGQGKSQAAD